MLQNNYSQNMWIAIYFIRTASPHFAITEKNIKKDINRRLPTSIYVFFALFSFCSSLSRSVLNQAIIPLAKYSFIQNKIIASCYAFLNICNLSQPLHLLIYILPRYFSQNHLPDCEIRRNNSKQQK